jgi:hypothetical protein
MRVTIRGRNPFAFLFARPWREDYLAQYVLREYARGRSLEDVLSDPYVRNRSAPEERARLLERPEMVAEIGQRTVADLKLALADMRAEPRGKDVRLRPPLAARGRSDA